ncbi:MAG: hypothetical protein Q7S47_01930 [bacterium]|nr:hypothetical protein [bacterium]
MRLNRLTIFFASLFLALSPFPVSAQQYSYDAVVRQGSITFSRSDLYAGEPVRVYGNIINLGIQDIAGTVTFYQGAIPLGNPLPFSLRAQSASEDFWVDWTPTEGTYNIMMGISSTNPEDQNPSNNTAVTSVMTITKRPSPPPPTPTATASNPEAGAADSAGNDGLAAIKYQHDVKATIKNNY